MWLQSGTYLTRQVTLNKWASSNHHQTSEAVKIHTPRGTDVFAAGPAVETSWKNVWTEHHWHHPDSKNVKMLCKLQLKGHKCRFTDRYCQRAQAQGASHEQRWRHGVQRGWKGTLSHGSVPFFTGRFHTAFEHFFKQARSHRLHFDLLHLHLLLLHLLLLPPLSCLLKTQQKRCFTLSCSIFAKRAHFHSRPASHVRPPYDAASLGPPHSWSSLSQPSSSPPGESGLPPGAERASVSGSSPPPELGSCRPSVCPKRRKENVNKHAATPSNYRRNRKNKRGVVHSWHWTLLTSLLRRSFLTLSML